MRASTCEKVRKSESIRKIIQNFTTLQIIMKNFSFFLKNIIPFLNTVGTRRGASPKARTNNVCYFFLFFEVLTDNGILSTTLCARVSLSRG